MDVSRAPSDRLIQAALRGLSLRQKAIADNVANASTPGFKATSVEFEGALRQAIARGNRGVETTDAELAPKMARNMQTSRGVDGNNVDIDQQMVELAQTNITYNALAQLTAARLRTLRNVVREGHG